MTERGGSSGSDPIGDFQRWLMRKSAQGLGGQLKGQARRTFGGSKPRADVWEAATTEPVTDEAPECAWCPICRAARRLRESGPGLASHVAGAGDALFSVAQDALAAFEATLASRPPGHGHGSPGQAQPGPAQAQHGPAQAQHGPAQAPAAGPDEPDDRG